ncbi:hypothetical protein BESB_058870 [Besnoitia besnoiti]|uniref:Uncharacterized protein n=1 Tax=Besnoitia besnoiti TaxID=94643 RepID=A0A2A9MHW6_BESBE|nr:hypothetical protein BESB_058870 [Besnoitia besnoiti]PFH35000.1 hypothetical protein BESB_058870 [Besnoitia besnoiti]
MRSRYYLVCQLWSQEDLDASLLRLLLEGTDSASSSTALSCPADASVPSQHDPSLFSTSFLSGDGDEDDGEDEDEKDREGDRDQSDRASLDARIVEGGVTTHLIRLTPGVPQLSGLCMQAIDQGFSRLHAAPVQDAISATGAAHSRASSAAKPRGLRGSSCWATELEGEADEDFSGRSECGLQTKESAALHDKRHAKSAAALPCTTGSLPSSECSSAATCRRGVLPPAGYHLVDGFLGAAGEQDAVDPAIFPPDFSDGKAAFAAWAHHVLALSSTDSRAPYLAQDRGNAGSPDASPSPPQEDEKGPSAAAGTSVPQAGSGGFPVTLPEFGEDNKWGWWREASTTLPLHASPVYARHLFELPLSAQDQLVARHSAGALEEAGTGGTRCKDVAAGPRGAECSDGDAKTEREDEQDSKRIQNREGAWEMPETGEACPHERRRGAWRPEAATDEEEGKRSGQENAECCFSPQRLGAARLRVICESSFSLPGVSESGIWEAGLLLSRDAVTTRTEGGCSGNGGQAHAETSSSSRASLDEATARATEDNDGGKKAGVCIPCGVRSLHAFAVSVLTRDALLPILPNPLPSSGCHLLLAALEGEADAEASTQGGKHGRIFDEPREAPSRKPAVVSRRREQETALEETRGKNRRGVNAADPDSQLSSSGTGSPLPLFSGTSVSSLCCCCCLESARLSPRSLSVFLPLLKLATFLLSCVTLAKADGLPACTALQLLLDETKRRDYLKERSSALSPRPRASSESPCAASGGDVCVEKAPDACRQEPQVSLSLSELVESLRIAAEGLKHEARPKRRDRRREEEAKRKGGQPKRPKPTESLPTHTAGADQTEEDEEASGHGGEAESNTTEEEDLLSAAVGQAFLLIVSLLQSLRFLVVVSGAQDWHLVEAQAASRRYCVRRQEVVKDHIAKLKHEEADGGDDGEPLTAGEPEQPGCGSECGGVASRQSAACSPPSSPSPCVASSALSPSNRHSEERPSGCGAASTCASQRRPFLPAHEPAAARCALAGVSPLILRVWGDSGFDAFEMRKQRTVLGDAEKQGRFAGSPPAYVDAFASGDSQGSRHVPRRSCVMQVAQEFFARLFFDQQRRDGQAAGRRRGEATSSRVEDAVNSAMNRETEPGARIMRNARSSPSSGRVSESASGRLGGHIGQLYVLQNDVAPVAAWLRLDGRVHESLLQVLALRCWSLLGGKPGSSAREVRDALAILDLADVSFLLQSWTRDGILQSASLSPSSSSSSPSPSLAFAPFSSSFLSTFSTRPQFLSSACHLHHRSPVARAPAVSRQLRKRHLACVTGAPSACPLVHASSGSEKRRRKECGSTPSSHAMCRKRGNANDARKSESNPRARVDEEDDGCETGYALSSGGEREERQGRRDASAAKRVANAFSLSAIRRIVEKTETLALHVKTLYFPSRAEDVLPGFQDLLLPRSLCGLQTLE